MHPIQRDTFPTWLQALRIALEMLAEYRSSVLMKLKTLKRIGMPMVYVFGALGPIPNPNNAYKSLQSLSSLRHSLRFTGPFGTTRGLSKLS